LAEFNSFNGLPPKLLLTPNMQKISLTKYVPKVINKKLCYIFLPIVILMNPKNKINPHILNKTASISLISKQILAVTNKAIPLKVPTLESCKNR
jgi:hypothetical protein